MEKAALDATTRNAGKGVSRQLRRDGRIPAVLYGKGRDPQALALNARALQDAMKTSAGMNILVDLTIDGKEMVVSRFKDVQSDPIRHHLVHLDLQAIDMKEKIVVEVPLHFVGKAEGVKEGGIVEVSRRSIEVKCLPTAIPSSIDVDITPMNLGENIHVNDITLPVDVELAHTENFSIVQIVAPQKEEEVVAAVAEGEVPVAGEAAAPAEGADDGDAKGGDDKAEKKG